MKNFLVFLLISLSAFAAQAQPKTKQIIVEGSGQPLVLLHGGTFDYTAYAPHSKLLSGSFMVISMQQFNVQFDSEAVML